jgi:hypothetical protein
MKIKLFFRSVILTGLVLLVAGSGSGQKASKPPESDASKLVYADFQNVQSGRPVSKHGGMVRLNQYSQNAANPPQFRGLENANPPRRLRGLRRKMLPPLSTTNFASPTSGRE